MGTPYPVKPESFLDKDKGFAFRSIWGGPLGKHYIRHNRYSLEDKEQTQ